MAKPGSNKGLLNRTSTYLLGASLTVSGCIDLFPPRDNSECHDNPTEQQTKQLDEICGGADYKTCMADIAAEQALRYPTHNIDPEVFSIYVAVAGLANLTDVYSNELLARTENEDFLFLAREANRHCTDVGYNECKKIKNTDRRNDCFYGVPLNE